MSTSKRFKNLEKVFNLDSAESSSSDNDEIQISNVDDIASDDNEVQAALEKAKQIFSSTESVSLTEKKKSHRAVKEKLVVFEPKIEEIAFWKELNEWFVHQCDCCKKMNIGEFVNRDFLNDIDILLNE